MDKVSSKKKKYIIIIVSVIALILCIGIVYLIVNKSKNKVNNNNSKSTSITSTTINAETTTTHKPEKITIKVEDYIFSDISENFKNINDVDYNKKSENNITYEKDNDLFYAKLSVENGILYESIDKNPKVESGYLKDKSIKKLYVIPDEGSYLVYVLTSDGNIYLNENYKVDNFKKVSSSIKADDFTFISYGGTYTGECSYADILIVKSGNHDYIITSSGPELYDNYKKNLNLLAYPFCFADIKFKVNYNMKLIDYITNKAVLDSDKEEISVDYMVRDNDYIYVVNSKYFYRYDYVTEKFDKYPINKITKKKNGLTVLLDNGDQIDLNQQN